MTPGRLLEGKRALITGGSRNLGRALCATFTSLGARVAFTWTRNEEDARATREVTRVLGSEARDFRVSVLDQQATAAMFDELERDQGGVDVLINNCGVNQNLPLTLLEEEDFDRVMAVNVKGAFLTSKIALKGMIRRREGTIVNLSSIVATRMLGAPVHYVASKAALEGLTRAIAGEVARHGVRVNCVAAGLLEGGISGGLPEHHRKDYLVHAALHRVVAFDEVAKLVAFVASGRNGAMTGETIHVDGGL